MTIKKLHFWIHAWVCYFVSFVTLWLNSSYSRLCFRYKTLDEFAVDARLIFDNCETFNEDDSDVGRAGHAMRSFFENRWMELTELS